MKFAVISCITDQYDEPKTHVPQDVECEFVCVPDPGGTIHPNRRAKLPKLFPWAYALADYYVWLDGSFRITRPDFCRWIASYGFAQFRHPQRDCIYAEASECANLPKYRDEPCRGQVAAYRAAGHPEHWGLWATGVIGGMPHNLGARWSNEIDRWSYQDQLSQPFVLRELGLRPAELPDSHMTSPYLSYEPSVKH